MSADYTRRDFLRVSGLGGTALAATGGVSKLKSVSRRTVAAHNPGTIAVWVTNENQRLASASRIKWRAAAGQAPSGSVLLDPAKRFQPILGFGAAFTDAACYLFNQLSGEARAGLFHRLFHPSEMGLNVCRICIGSSDYSTKVYSYDEGGPDPELQRFSIEPDRAYILPMLREARKVNPDLLIFRPP